MLGKGHLLHSCESEGNPFAFAFFKFLLAFIIDKLKVILYNIFSVEKESSFRLVFESEARW